MLLLVFHIAARATSRCANEVNGFLLGPFEPSAQPRIAPRHTWRGVVCAAHIFACGLARLRRLAAQLTQALLPPDPTKNQAQELGPEGLQLGGVPSRSMAITLLMAMRKSGSNCKQSSHNSSYCSFSSVTPVHISGNAAPRFGPKRPFCPIVDMLNRDAHGGHAGCQHAEWQRVDRKLRPRW